MRSFLLVILLYSGAAYGQCEPECSGKGKQAVVHGRIVNSNGEPARGVKVKVTEHGCYRSVTTTDVYGMYKVVLKPGAYEFSSKFKTGTEDSKKVIVYKGECVQVNFDERSTQNRELLNLSEDDDERLH